MIVVQERSRRSSLNGMTGIVGGVAKIVCESSPPPFRFDKTKNLSLVARDSPSMVLVHRKPDRQCLALIGILVTVLKCILSKAENLRTGFNIFLLKLLKNSNVCIKTRL